MPLISRPAPLLLLVLALSLCAGSPSRALAQGVPPGGGPLALQISAQEEEFRTRVTLTFSAPVQYRLEESRLRLNLLLDVPLDENSEIDRSFEGGALRRIRVSSSSRGSEVIFHLGREFETFSSMEMTNPFRVVLEFQKKGATTSSPASRGTQDGGGPAEPAPAAPPQDARVVVLDPGHGGSEAGAVGSGGLKEKDLVLDIATRLRTLLQRSGHTVILTREGDSALDLTRRTAAANYAKADLFLSIHANASARGAARGAETYFLSYGDVADQEAMSVASQENLQAAASQARGGEEEGEIRMVLWEMAQTEHLSRSSQLADLIQLEMNALGGTKDRGVKQAPFRVLVGAAMPAVLVEVGFLSNSGEEKKLATPEYRDRIAEALAGAVERFERERGARNEGDPAAPSGGVPR
jgi:N-acetylmuramoyl-L-alanine amidase